MNSQKLVCVTKSKLLLVIIFLTPYYFFSICVSNEFCFETKALQTSYYKLLSSSKFLVGFKILVLLQIEMFYKQFVVLFFTAFLMLKCFFCSISISHYDSSTAAPYMLQVFFMCVFKVLFKAFFQSSFSTFSFPLHIL